MKKAIIVLAVACLAVSSSLLAITDFQTIAIPFTHDLNGLRASLNLPVSDTLIKITVPYKKLKTRAFNPRNDQTIEPLSITIPRSETGLQELVRKIALPGKSEALSEMLLSKLKKQGPSDKSSLKLDLEPSDFKLINIKAIGDDLARDHHSVTIHTKDLASDPATWSEFKTQLAYLLPKEQIAKISRKVKGGVDLKLDEDLLPNFARKMAGKFIIFRGPNCFHAALAFFNQAMTRLPTINVKEEEGYHKSMINYDELWRVISNQFYEIDTRTTPLKYGDLMVFFATPPETPKHINFKSIRHTAIYLLGPYTFSKGSKSPNTPYSVKTLQEEWTTWQAMTQNLGLKIYRRQLMSPEVAMPTVRDDWIY